MHTYTLAEGILCTHPLFMACCKNNGYLIDALGKCIESVWTYIQFKVLRTQIYYISLKIRFGILRVDF